MAIRGKSSECNMSYGHTYSVIPVILDHDVPEVAETVANLGPHRTHSSWNF